jgi:rRNA maturation protein Rpf1
MTHFLVVSVYKGVVPWIFFAAAPSKEHGTYLSFSENNCQKLRGEAIFKSNQSNKELIAGNYRIVVASTVSTARSVSALEKISKYTTYI